MSEIAKLFVSIGADLSDFKKGMGGLGPEAKHAFDDVEKSGKRAADALDATGRSANELGNIFKGGLAASLVADGFRMAAGAVSDFISGSLAHIGEVEQIMAQTNAAIASTGGAAHVTSTQIADMANSIEAATGVSGEMIQRGENLLLTFTNLKNGAGAGNDVFNQTTKVMADMSVALGQDATASAMQLGKALNDPIKGVSALQRVGVSFTQSQKDTIKALQESGKTMAAQKLILAELAKEFGGSAAAFGKTWPGVIAKVEAAWENLGDSLLGPLMPAFKAGITTVANMVNNLSTAIGDQGLGAVIASAFGPTSKALILGLGAAVAVAVTPSILAAGAAAVAALPAIAAGFTAGVVAAWPLVATAAAVAFAARPIIEHWSAIPGAFSAYFGLAEATALEWYQTVKSVATGVSDGFWAAAKNIATYMSKAFGGVGAMIKGVWDRMPEMVRGPLSALPGMFKAVAVDLGGAFALPFKAIGKGVRAVTGVVGTIGTEFGSAAQIGGQYLSDMKAYINSFAGDAVKAFKKTGDAAGDMGGHAAKGASKAKAATDAAKKAAQEVAQAMEHIAGGLRSIVDLVGFANIANVVKGMNAQLAKVESHARDAGAGFDAWADTAKVLVATLAKLDKAGLSKGSGLYLQLANDLNVARAASGRFQEAQKELGSTFQTMSAGLETNAAKALVLGPTYDVLAADIQTLETGLDSLLGATVKNVEAIDRTKAQLDGLRAQVPPAVSSFDSFKGAMEGTAQAASLMREGLATIGQVLGVEMGNPVAAAAIQVLDLGLAITQVIAAVPAVVAGVKAIALAINTSLGPIGWIAIAIAAVTTAIAALSKGQDKAEKTTESFTKLYGNSMRKVGKDTADAIAGLKGFGEDYQTVMKAIKSASNFDDLMAGIVAAQQKIKTGFASAMTGGLNSSIKGFLTGTKSMTEGLREGIRDAITNGIIEGFLKRGVIENMLGPLLDTLTGQMEKNALPSEMSGTIAAIGQKVPQIASMLESVFAPLKNTLDRAFSDTGDKVAGIMATRAKALSDITFKQKTLGSMDAAGGLSARASATEAAMTALRDAGQTASNQFGDLSTDLAKTRAALAGLEASAQAAKNAQSLDEKSQPAITDLQSQVARMLDAGEGATKAYRLVMEQLHDLQSPVKAAFAVSDRASAASSSLQAAVNLRPMATGGLATGPTRALVGEGAYKEAVLPLSPSVFAQLGRGIADQGGAGGNTTVHITINASSRDVGETIVRQLSRLGIRAT